MLSSIASGLLCGAFLVAPSQAPLAIDPDLPFEQTPAEAYDLTATYEGLGMGALPALAFDQQDDRNGYVVQMAGKRLVLQRVLDGKPTALASARLPRRTDTAPLELTVCRRPGLIRVLVNASPAVEAYDTTFVGGTCGCLAGPKVAAPADLYLQELGPIQFDDDFFAGDDRVGAWVNLTGAFQVGVYWDPKQKLDDRPIGASWYENAAPGENLAAAGDAFWDDYSCQVSTRPASGSTVGLAFRVRDAANYGLLTLATPTAGPAQARLVEVVGGQQRLLGETSGRWPADQWHRLAVEATGAVAVARLDGQVVAQGNLTAHPAGRVGLYAHTEGNCRFDDVAVRGLQRFAAQAQPQPRGPWTFVSGRWRGEKTRLTARASSPALALASLGDWGDCVVESEVHPAVGSAAGVVARWGEQGGYALVVSRDADGQRCAIQRLDTAGQATDLSPSPADLLSEAPSRLRLVAHGAALEGFANGACVAKAWDTAFDSGQAGLLANDGEAVFADFTLTAPPDDDAITVIAVDGSPQTRPGAEHGLFERFVGDLWRPFGRPATLIDRLGEPCVRLDRGGLWYYLPRPGDVTLSADVLSTDGSPLQLRICATPGRDRTGYSLGLTSGELALYRGEEQAQSAALPAADGGPLHIELSRDGPYVVAAAGHTVLTLRDPEPLPAGHAVVRCEGQAVIDNLSLGARHSLAYRFDRVEPDWVPASGEWLFHSGMACIPWAYWLTGDGRETPAMAWDRRQAPADLTVSFDVSEYTVGYESGDHEHFPYHDISLAIGAQEMQPDSGYRFVIGAEGGRSTRLYRQGQLVAENRDPRFSIAMGPHCNTPRAIEVVATKQAATLTLTLNGQPALAYEDADPLGPGLVGLGAAGCRANFRDLFLYRDNTWALPLGASGFSDA